MTSQFADKGLPPPPLRIDKRHNTANSNQAAASSQPPTQAFGPSDSSASGPSHLGTALVHADADATASRTPSGRFRIRVPSLTKQARSAEVAQNTASAQNTPQRPSVAQTQDKAWQPRWAPKLKRTNPSKSVTTYSPILGTPLPPLPSLMTSPPPAVQLDDAGFGRPFSTTGLFDLSDARFSFLDMRIMENDSDSDSSDSLVDVNRRHPPPIIREPPRKPNTQGDTPAKSDTPTVAAPSELAIKPVSVERPSTRGMLMVPPTSSTTTSQDPHSAHASLPATSPALASLISSFPSPLTRDSDAAPSSCLDPTQSVDSRASKRQHEAATVPKDSSWDEDERWGVDSLQRNRVSSGHDSDGLPYLDMEDEDEAELFETPPTQPIGASMQSALGLSTISPPKSRLIRNPPPQPAPSMALPDLPAQESTAALSNVRRHTPSSSIQLDNAPQDSASSTKQSQRPLLLPTLRSSSSIDRLAAMGSANDLTSTEPAPARTANGGNLKPLMLPGATTASTEELARSLDIPRETVRQMLDTTQHVWRNHLLGSSYGIDDAPLMMSGPKRLSKSSSSPMLSTLFAAEDSMPGFESSEDASRGSVYKSVSGKGSNRTSMLGLPYISSSKPSFEHQNPGWAVRRNDADAIRASAIDSRTERARNRRTFLGRSSEEGWTASYNFSRPIRREANGIDVGMTASASMPSLAAARELPKPPALLQSPLLLKGESEATGFAQIAVDDDQEVLVDSGSEAHPLLAPSQDMLLNNGISADPGLPAIKLADASGQKMVPELPAEGQSALPRPRRNSDTVLNAFAPEFGKREPGELHAWSVCIDQDGVPAIRPSVSAFHRPNCALAGKTNATWQCGCRASISSEATEAMSPRVAGIGAQNLAVPGQASPGRSRSLSASHVLDPIRQAQLWGQVERNKELIRKHEERIAGLQEQVERMSTEMASARPSFCSTFPTPELLSTPNFPAPPNRADPGARKPLPAIVSEQFERPPVPAKSPVVGPYLGMRAAHAPTPSRSASSTRGDPPRTLRGRIASLSKMNVGWRDENIPPPETVEVVHPSHLRASASTSSLNKVFRFPWSRSSDKVNNAFPQPTPFPLGERNHNKAASVSASLSRGKGRPSERMLSVDEQRPLPAPPLSDASMTSKDKRFPPSSRKFSFDMLHGPAFQTSVGSRHLRGHSGSSKSSSFGTSIFSSNEGLDVQETSRFASFARLGRRWDSISSRGTNGSTRNSADVSTQPTRSSFGSMPALSTLAAAEATSLANGKPMPSLPGQFSQSVRRTKTPPPRRSSLMRNSLDGGPTKRAPIPGEFLQTKDPLMAPISEQSEVGSPASTRAARNVEVEMSPASAVASPAGEARMSMSERYRLQGLTVPAPLALSSSMTSPMLGSMTEPLSASKASASPRPGKSPLPVGFSHGTLTVARPPSMMAIQS